MTMTKRESDTIMLSRAIERSREQDRTVRCRFEGTEADLRVALHVIYDGEFDTSPENDGTIDAYGWIDEVDIWMLDPSHDWRLSVTLVACGQT